MIGVFTKKQGTLKASFNIALGGPTTKKKNTQISGMEPHVIWQKPRREDKRGGDISITWKSSRNTLPSKMESCDSIISTNGYLPLHEFSSGGEITCIKY
jgi:hypothetical protein